MKMLTMAAAMLGLASLCFAEGEETLQPLMKSIAATAGKMRKDAEAKSAPDLAKDGADLQALYKQIGDFFAKRGGMDDAVKIARDAEMASKDLAAGGSEEKTMAAMKTIGGSCAGCHMAHRDKAADGTYKIK